ncbi:unnamed protein product [Didymodactylos carnosus]|uniref:CCHC-type domain-containing protein n=1 Tax=Didymodactylos carnosus TaxID=1234261 RepID=A0A815I998_9BILA|nr:unnamed protein product [Didymodactylos carnosus]CAF4241173.1 unnamed protein product [Didymodactylos carnosus]
MQTEAIIRVMDKQQSSSRTQILSANTLTAASGDVITVIPGAPKAQVSTASLPARLLSVYDSDLSRHACLLPLPSEKTRTAKSPVFPTDNDGNGSACPQNRQTNFYRRNNNNNNSGGPNNNNNSSCLPFPSDNSVHFNRSNSSAADGNREPPGPCPICRKNGHWRRDCRCPFLRQIGHGPGGSLLPSAADGFERLKWTEFNSIKESCWEPILCSK